MIENTTFLDLQFSLSACDRMEVTGLESASCRRIINRSQCSFELGHFKCPLSELQFPLFQVELMLSTLYRLPINWIKVCKVVFVLENQYSLVVKSMGFWLEPNLALPSAFCVSLTNLFNLSAYALVFTFKK